MNPILIVLLIAAFLALFIVLFVTINNSRYKKFVYKHSICCKQLNALDARYNFIEIPLDVIRYDYDHEVNFNNVSCSDYLIGYMNDNLTDFTNALYDTAHNREAYILYKEDVLKIDRNAGFDKEIKHFREKKLKKYETKLFNKYLLEPTLYLDVKVVLSYYDMGDNFKGRKHYDFKEEEIKSYIGRLKNRSGYFYNDDEIWQALTRYERGKVSLKLRFSIYERDNYTCKCCGKHGYRNDLEIDHIVPISRGGKSTYDNLQTLCHNCNYKKGSKAAKY